MSVHRSDVSSADGCRRLIADALTVTGRLDLLVNNAGFLSEKRLADIGEAEWAAALDRNLSSAFFLSQAAIPVMLDQRFGRIVNVGSVSALMGSPFQIDYATAKAGLIGLTRSLARAVARKGITVNCVMHGGVATDMLDSMELSDRAQIERSIPVGRYGQLPEIAHIICALLHDDASYVTGSVVVVDGGLGMGD